MSKDASQGKPLGLIVQKFGGTSVGSLERIEKSARIILDKWKMGSAPVVVVSAMSGETNRLEKLARSITHREDASMEMVLSAGEQVTVGLMSLMLDELAREEGLISADEKIAAPSLAHQLPIGTHSHNYADAQIDYINHAKIHSIAHKRMISVLPGYQAYNGSEVMTLGRGGSDTSAVSIAGLIGADLCEIYTDVDGIYSTDPRVCKDALKYDLITTDEMQILSRNGAKVMHHKAIDAASRYRVPVVVKSSFEPKNQGTLIVHPDLVEQSRKVEQESASSFSSIYGLTMLNDVMVVEVPSQKGLEQKIEENLNLLSLTKKTSRNGDEHLQVMIASKYWDHLDEILKQEELNVNQPKTLYSKVSILGENLNDGNQGYEAIEKAINLLDGKGKSIKGIHKNKQVVTLLVNREAVSEVTNKIHKSCLNYIGTKVKGIDPANLLSRLQKGEVIYGR